MIDKMKSLRLIGSLFLILMVALPTVFLELFPFSVYPMLSESWKGYSQVIGKDLKSKQFLKEHNVNPNYFGVPQNLPVGRSYNKSLLTFGKSYSSLEVKSLMAKFKSKDRLCFLLETYSQNKEGVFGVREQEDFCLE
ncbi:MAG: hypothetical protein NXH75_06180 [Halobacteriovoraceae bacterium]|nr:hypothetical protein [Halobacteriovoraceae bacterium]